MGKIRDRRREIFSATPQLRQPAGLVPESILCNLRNTGWFGPLVPRRISVAAPHACHCAQVPDGAAMGRNTVRRSRRPQPDAPFVVSVFVVLYESSSEEKFISVPGARP
jgi:hypothetical protein